VFIATIGKRKKRNKKGMLTSQCYFWTSTSHFWLSPVCFDAFKTSDILPNIFWINPNQSICTVYTPWKG